MFWKSAGNSDAEVLEEVLPAVSGAEAADDTGSVLALGAQLVPSAASLPADPPAASCTNVACAAAVGTAEQGTEKNEC